MNFPRRQLPAGWTLRVVWSVCFFVMEVQLSSGSWIHSVASQNSWPWSEGRSLPMDSLKVVTPSLSSRTSPAANLSVYKGPGSSIKSLEREIILLACLLSPSCIRYQVTERWVCWAVALDDSQVSSNGSPSSLLRVWEVMAAERVSGMTGCKGMIVIDWVPVRLASLDEDGALTQHLYSTYFELVFHQPYAFPIANRNIGIYIHTD